jgi:hypothetical protein
MPRASRKKRRAGGSSSKRTGSRYELELIDELAAKGLKAQRVPLSGAAGGHFGSDVMVWPNAITSFSIESKYRSSTAGFKNLLRRWAVLGHTPVKIGELLLMKLQDFPSELHVEEHPVLEESVPALLNDWMSQAQATFGVVAIRLPKRELDFRWVVIIDASSLQLLRTITWPTPPES